MKKIILFLATAIMSTAIASGQVIPEILKNDKALKSIFVDPLGITGALSDSDPKSVESKVEKTGLEYTTMNLGVGEAFAITPDDFEIDGVKIDRLTITVSSGINMLMYFSAPSPQYMDIVNYLESKLKQYGIDSMGQNTTKNGDTTDVYIVTPQIGIGISTFKSNQTVQIMLIDLNNLKLFNSGAEEKEAKESA